MLNNLSPSKLHTNVSLMACKQKDRWKMKMANKSCRILQYRIRKKNYLPYPNPWLNLCVCFKFLYMFNTSLFKKPCSVLSTQIKLVFNFEKKKLKSHSSNSLQVFCANSLENKQGHEHDFVMGGYNIVSYNL